MLSEVYSAMGESGAEGAARWLDKARRLESCASYAEFSRLPDGQGLHLYQSSFCRVRLCPMCQWRRSLKLGAQVRRVVERANADHIADTGAAWRWLMVTFTIKNVQGPELGATIDRVQGPEQSCQVQALERRCAWLAPGNRSYTQYKPRLCRV